MEHGKQFGQYQLIKRVASGGMAEIHLAKTEGIAGFEKLLALKVINPKFSSDQEFIDMLIDEAKLAVQLSHVNIGQTFDLGRIDDVYFIAMEFIDGRDLYQLLVRCAELEKHIPFDIVTFIGMEVAAGLQYAHTKCDNYGRPLDLIHRDISPQNVLISFGGEIKIVDFGIAKASQRSRETESGVIKGKFFYMSPEQAWGDPIDGRTDIFSAGICLYEMVTGEMLYQEEKALVLLDRVRKAEIPSMRARRRDLPPELEKIVLEALARNRDDRFAHAGHLQNALQRFLFGNWPGFNRQRVAEFMDEVFGDQRAVVAPPEPMPAPVPRRAAPPPIPELDDDPDNSQLMNAGDFDVRTSESVIFNLNALEAGEPSSLDDLDYDEDDDDQTIAGAYVPPDVVDDDEEHTIAEPYWSSASGAPDSPMESTRLLDADLMNALPAVPTGSVTGPQFPPGSPSPGMVVDDVDDLDLPTQLFTRPTELGEGATGPNVPPPMAVPVGATPLEPAPASDEGILEPTHIRPSPGHRPDPANKKTADLLPGGAGASAPKGSTSKTKAGAKDRVDASDAFTPRDKSDKGAGAKAKGAKAKGAKAKGGKGKGRTKDAGDNVSAQAKDRGKATREAADETGAQATKATKAKTAKGKAAKGKKGRAKPKGIAARAASWLFSAKGFTLTALVALTVYVGLQLMPTVTSEPESKTAILIVDSTPGRAEIELDGQPTGKHTPARFDDIAIGTNHTLELKLKGFEPYNDTLMINAETLPESREVKRRFFLEKAKGKLVLETTPAGAEIYIGGKYAGETPLTKVDVDRGRNEIVILVRKPGYRERREIVRWDEETELRMEWELQKRR